MNKTRVHVGGLPQGVRESDLEEFFRGYGRIRDVLIKGRFAYVEFTDQRDAADAVFQRDGKTLLGQQVSVQRAREMKKEGRDKSFTRDSYRKEDNEQYRVTVENLSTRVLWQDLIDIMSRFGKVDFAKAHNLIRNEGMVQFSSYSGMKRAIEELDRTELDGQRIRVKSKVEYQSRQRQRFRSPVHRPNPYFRSRSPIHRTRRERNNSVNRPFEEKRNMKY